MLQVALPTAWLHMGGGADSATKPGDMSTDPDPRFLGTCLVAKAKGQATDEAVVIHGLQRVASSESSVPRVLQMPALVVQSERVG